MPWFVCLFVCWLVDSFVGLLISRIAKNSGCVFMNFSEGAGLWPKNS